jgi:hypothetical protein
MACQIVRAPGGVFCVWGKPEAEDVDRVIETLLLASRDAGGPVVYVTRVPVGAPAPEGRVKELLSQNMARIVGACSSYHVVLEGEGFGSAFKRGVLTSLLQPIWRKRMFFVHARCADVTPKLLPEELAGAEAVLKVAQSKGLTYGPLPAAREGARAQL